MKFRFQFRLRSLMIGVTVLAMLCAVGVPLLREWLKPEPVVEPWLPAGAFTNGSLPGVPIPASKGTPIPVPVGTKPPPYAGYER